MLNICLLICIYQLDAQIKVDFSGYNTKSEIKVTKADTYLIRAEWKTNDGGQCAVSLNLKDKEPLFKALEASADQEGKMTTIASNINPRFDLRIGTRAENSLRSSTKF